MQCAQPVFTFLAPEADTYYAILGNVDLAALPHNMDVDLSIAPVTVTATSPPGVVSGAFTDPAEVHWYAIDIPAGGTLHAFTLDGATSTCAAQESGAAL